MFYNIYIIKVNAMHYCKIHILLAMRKNMQYFQTQEIER